MQIQLNDKVKFLDEEGGGIITKIIDHAMVEVTTPDGFSFPYQIRNLVKPEDNSPARKLFNKDMTDFENIPKASESKSDFQLVNEVPLQIEKGLIKPEQFAVYLAFIPRDQFRLVFGNIDVFLMNVSNLPIYFVLFREDEAGFKMLSQGKISPFSRIHLSEINREELGSWEKLIVQFILLTDGLKQIRGPVDTLLKIRGNRFFTENSYIRTDFMRERAIVYDITRTESIPVLHQINQNMEKGQEQKIEKVHAEKKQNRLIFDYQVSKGQAVVDIHIWKLTDDELALSAHQKLMLQLDYFKLCLESAKENHFDKVVFIHGVGTGRLKEEIQIYLDDNNISHKAAPMAEYGLGAIQVILAQNSKF